MFILITNENVFIVNQNIEKVYEKKVDGIELPTDVAIKLVQQYQKDEIKKVRQNVADLEKQKNSILNKTIKRPFI